MDSGECVRCGYCCTVAPCPFGTWDEANHRCVHLTKENECDKYEDIIGRPGAEWSPAFGAGCCSGLNPVRRNILATRAGAALSGRRTHDRRHDEQRPASDGIA